ncbi:MAG: hypothetical protein B9S32_04670 [Verrucomicrobia bacterium Tous-C9LFEB]|nr:MAG: hypothetical protein B9S32_04670 [Verrucomicrobia bacterium Tous-C9LFEB]
MSNSVVINHPSQGAMYMLSRGFKPFPVIERDKRPLVKDWQQWANRASRGLISTYALEEVDYNWGILPAASGHLVLDIDSGYKLKNKRVIKAIGDKSLARLEEEHGKLPETFTVRTPSGGEHRYFKGTCRPTQSVLGKHIDTRSEASYVVAPGSTCHTIDGKGNKIKGTYTIINDVEPAECPEWMLGLLTRKVEVKAAPNCLAVSKLDTESNIAEAMEFLASAPLCVEGDGTHGGEYLLNIFMELRDRGVSQEKAKTLVLQNYNDRCDPPWELTDEHHASHFHKKLHNAYTYAKNPIGIKTEEARTAAAQSDFMDAAISPAVTESNKPIPLHWANEINPRKTPKRKVIMRERYMAGTVTAIVAQGGLGKSTLTMTDSAGIVTGKSLTGFEVVTKGRVWIYNLEDDADELRRRFEAIFKCHNLPIASMGDIAFTSGVDDPLLLATSGRDGAKINKEDVNRLIETIQQNNISILFLDPFSRCHTAKENDNSEMNVVMSALAEITKRTGCAICIVHHASKAGTSKDADPSDQGIGRGASAISCAVRCCQNLAEMKPKEAEDRGIPPEDRHLYFKLVDAKANLYVKKSDCTWYMKKSIQLENGESVGAIEWVDLPSLSECKNQIEKVDQGEEVLKFLREHLSGGDTMPLGRLQEIAEQRDLAALKGVKNITTFQRKLAAFLADSTEYYFTRGLKNAWQISREDVI